MQEGSRFLEVSSDLWVWGRYEASIRTWMHSTALRAGNGIGWWILDPIVLEEAEWEQRVRRLGADGGVLGYVVTNGNHERELARWQERLPGEVLAHAAAMEEISSGVDRELQPGMILAGGYEVVGMEGAGTGEVALLREDVSAHFGDGLLNLDETGFAFLPEKYCVDAIRLRRSVRRFMDCPVRVATFAHGFPLRGDVGRRIRALCSG